ncbi:hypothetical protein CEXT_94551 [Caerostris extrusa]|uniref:Uncharacterized protein n=1 Tax=Caerostris extrusa TaxID=172846 RepID=A0AAV4Y323_CAEEX|nr:hypothetical protein CEXT_94551 [Caerostris extrusa]
MSTFFKNFVSELDRIALTTTDSRTGWQLSENSNFFFAADVAAHQLLLRAAPRRTPRQTPGHPAALREGHRPLRPEGAGLRGHAGQAAQADEGRQQRRQSPFSFVISILKLRPRLEENGRTKTNLFSEGLDAALNACVSVFSGRDE